MLDPLTATALASAVVQFVDFSSKVLAKTIEIYRDETTLDPSVADLDAKLVTQNLILVTQQLEPSAQLLTASTEYEAALLDLRARCVELGNELIIIFDRIGRTATGWRWKFWRSLRQAIRRVWNERKIREIELTLASIREQMNLHITTETANNVRDMQRDLPINRDLIIDHVTFSVGIIMVWMKSLKRYWIGGFLVLLVGFAVQSSLSISDRLDRKNNESQARRDKIVSWLTTLDFRQKQKDILASRYPETSTWLLSSPEFCDWLFDSNHALWLNGIPGSGKTVLTSVVIDYLQSHFQTNTSTASLAYVYCDYKDHIRQTTSNLIASILRQLVQGHPQLPLSSNLETLYDSHISSGTYPTLDLLHRLIQFELSKRKPAFIIIDALDECLETPAARAKFIRMIGELTPLAKLLLTSRPHINITSHIPEVRRLDVLASEHDIGRYVQGRIHDLDTEIGRVVHRNQELQDNIIAAVIAKAKGMFLLARFHMDSLVQKPDVRSVRRALKNLPTKLSEAYSDTMERIQNEEDDVRDLAMKVLSWVYHAIRPLSCTELQHALAVEPWEPRFDEEGLKNPDYLISVCAGLVVSEEGTGIVRLVHYSTEEYFQSLQQSRFPNAQKQIATTCLTYLGYDTYTGYNCSPNGFTYDEYGFLNNADEYVHAVNAGIDNLTSKNPFYEYAARYWGVHASGVLDLDLHDKILGFLDLDQSLFCSVQSKIISEYTWPWARSMVLTKPVPKLWVVAGFGLTQSSQTLIEGGVDVDATIHYASRPHPGSTALMEASFNGHLRTVWLLLKNGASQTKYCGQYGSPLVAAAFNGHTQILRVLLDSGAKIDAWDTNYGSALGAASYNGHAEAVQLLLDRGANATVRGDAYFGSILKMASSNGHEELVRLLLKSGAHVDETGISEGAWLLRLNEEGARRHRKEHEMWFRTRISQPGPFQASIRECENALHCACLFGHYRVARVLLENDAMVDFQGGLWGTALQAASFGGFQNIVQLLIEKGADVNAKGLLLGNALEAAAIYGQEDVIRLLLDAGADVASAGGGLLGGALQTASTRGHPHIVRLLLDKRGATYKAFFSGCTWFSRHLLRFTGAGTWCFVL